MHKISLCKEQVSAVRCEVVEEMVVGGERRQQPLRRRDVRLAYACA